MLGGLSYRNENIITLSNGLHSLDVENINPCFKNLNWSYGVMWSWAREQLEYELGLVSSFEVLRDYDIIRITENEPFEWCDDSLAQMYMPDDFKHGNWVREINEDYFSTRDLTINEVYYHNGKLYFTKECYDDLVASKIRLTWDTYSEYYGNHDFKNIIKALRLYIERKEQFPDSEIIFMNEGQLNDNYCNLFWIALNLDKAHFSWVSDKFLKLLQEIWYLPADLENPKEARRYIMESWDISDFNFKYFEYDSELVGEIIELLDDYEYEEYVFWDRVLEILDWLHNSENSKFNKWRIK